MEGGFTHDIHTASTRLSFYRSTEVPWLAVISPFQCSLLQPCSSFARCIYFVCLNNFFIHSVNRHFPALWSLSVVITVAVRVPTDDFLCKLLLNSVQPLSAFQYSNRGYMASWPSVVHFTSSDQTNQASWGVIYMCILYQFLGM